MKVLNLHLRADNDDSGNHPCIYHVVHIQLDENVRLLRLEHDWHTNVC